jgi:hypothetical protein
MEDYEVDYGARFEELKQGELSWIFQDPAKEEELSVQYVDWLLDNGHSTEVKGNPVRNQYYAGMFLDQVKDTLVKPRSVSYRPPPPSTISAIQPPKEVKFEKIKIDVGHEYFETEQGQWMLWFIFLALTILDWVTNVWALTQSLDMGVGLESANIWHWTLGGILVFSEIYLGLVRTLWRRTPKDRAQEVVILIVLWIIVLLAIGYDFIATLFPPYYAIGGVGGIITGLLLAGITTVGSSYFLQQSQIVWQLFKQRLPKK